MLLLIERKSRTTGAMSDDEDEGPLDCRHLCPGEAASNSRSREGPDDRAKHPESGQQAPILVRQDGARFVLVEGLHRLEACRSLGEETILGYLVEAPSAGNRSWWSKTWLKSN